MLASSPATETLTSLNTKFSVKSLCSSWVSYTLLYVTVVNADIESLKYHWLFLEKVFVTQAS